VKVKVRCLGFLLVPLFEGFGFFMPYFCPGKFWENGVFVGLYGSVYPIFYLLSTGIHDF